MAQVTLELSDPTDHGPQSLVDTDELLSQLAGEEIDRLLAEADLARPVVPPAPTSADEDQSARLPSLAEIDKPPVIDQSAAENPSADKTLTIDQARSIDLPRPIETSADLAGAAVDSSLPGPSIDEDDLSIKAEIDRLLAGEETKPISASDPDLKPTGEPFQPGPEGAEAAEAEPDSRETDSFAIGEERNAVLDAAGFESGGDQPLSVEAALLSDPVHEMEPIGDERMALLAAAGFNTNAADVSTAPTHAGATAQNPTTSRTNGAADAGKTLPSVAVEKSSEATHEVTSLPIFFRPLEWISAPLEHRSPAVRKILGNAAILTLVNALAILVYSLFIRKH